MDKILRNLFSMKMMSVGLILFLVGIGAATILESKYGIQTAKIIIYNHLWFEILLVYLTISLVINIFRYNMIQRDKIAMLMFHLSFIIIIIGAAVTRFISFEGQLKLPEPNHMGQLQPVQFIYSADPKIMLSFDGKYKVDPTMYFSEHVNNDFEYTFNIPSMEHPVTMSYVDFKSNQIDSLVVNDSIRSYALNIVTTNGGQRIENKLVKGEFIQVGDIPLSFEVENEAQGIHIIDQNGAIMMKTDFPMTYLPMSEMRAIRQSGQEVADSMYKQVPVDTLVPLRITTLYEVNGSSFVFNEKINHAKKMLLPAPRKNEGVDYLTIKLKSGDAEKEVTLSGGMTRIPATEFFDLGGHKIKAMYGSVPIELPFALACNDFQMEKYPGSQTPSSFASIVSVFNEKMEVEHEQKIFMNNVMDYKGYRFFQSGYYPDETGTILSVNHDWWGTNITYVGYLMMAIGMIMSLFAPIGRMRELIRKLNKISEHRNKLTILILLFSFGLFGQETDTVHDHSQHDHSGHNHSVEEASTTTLDQTPPKFVSKEHSEEFAKLLVQDQQGRIIPMHSMCDQLLRKIHRGSTYKDEDGQTYNAVQTILSMHMYSMMGKWDNKKVIYVSKVLRDTLHLDGTYASIDDLLETDPHTNARTFKLLEEYKEAHAKLDKNKSEFDKKLIKLGERFEIIRAFQTWLYFKIIPIEGDVEASWLTPFDNNLSTIDKEQFEALRDYFQGLAEGVDDKGYDHANTSIKNFIQLQRKKAGSIAPSENKVAMEISYNKAKVFSRVQYIYILAGFILFVMFVVYLLKNEKATKLGKVANMSLQWIIILAFLAHVAGLVIRSYVSGHEPWSNGYEALIFIAGVLILLGIGFRKWHKVVLPGAAILAFFMIFVTEMNLLDPEITNLQPVLKSYWLMIHVAIITSSYAFLGLGAMLGFTNLLLYIIRSKENGKLLTMNIKEISYISEIIITVGLFMLTIGTFLGGIWANESWGRYWGWDPKETWALVSVLVYAVILHLRFIPALKDKFTFNTVALWGYTAIIFTFFGVNFYLVGLHSYAQGDDLAEIPNWIAYTLLGFYIFTEFAATRYRLYKTDAKEIGLNYFMKKVTFIFGGFVLVMAFLLITKTLDTNQFFSGIAAIGLSIILTNLGMFGYVQLNRK